MQFTDPSYLALAERALTKALDSPVCLIAGLGNCLLRDDGVGVHAVRQLLPDPPPGALVLEVGTDVFSAVSWLEKAPRVLIIDAMEAGGAPGTMYRCNARDVRVDALTMSLHELGLLSVLEFVPRTRWPEIAVLGVQPALIDYGLELSPVLQLVLPRVVEAARTIASSWLPAGARNTRSNTHRVEQVVA